MSVGQGKKICVPDENSNPKSSDYRSDALPLNHGKLEGRQTIYIVLGPYVTCVLSKRERKDGTF